MKLGVFLTFSSFIVLGGVLASAAPSSSDVSTVIDLGYAKYAGHFTAPHSVAYLGVPYAEPPLNDRRFRAPVPLNTTRIRKESGGRVINAASYPEACVQGTTGNGDAGGAGSEDCLKINIYTPLGVKPGDKLPVLVYIHGGGYRYGNPRDWPFDHWINQSPNVVVVSVYYRLDSFGFLTHPDFVSNKALGDLNAGFLDQREALRWLQQHVSAFGGDPQRVTINGQSAGGSSVELHLVAKNEDGLFHGGIAQSVFRTPVPSPQQQEPLFNYFSSLAGCGTGSVSNKMRCLRKASISAIARAQDAAFASTSLPYNMFHPVLDTNTIAEYPTVSILNGRYRKLPLIVGATSNETRSSGTIPGALKTFFPSLTNKDINEFVREYPLSLFSSRDEQFRTATGEPTFRCAREIMAAQFSDTIKSFAYRYNQPNPTTGTNAVEHAAENWMMFKGTNTGVNGTNTFTHMTPEEDAFAEELIAYWLSFVRSGDPNTFKLSRSPAWPTYDVVHPQRIVLQQNGRNVSGSYAEAEPIAEIERCNFAASKVQREQN